MSVIITAQTIQTMGGPPAPNQLPVGGDPEDIAVNEATNKIYILNVGDDTVSKLGISKEYFCWK